MPRFNTYKKYPYSAILYGYEKVSGSTVGDVTLVYSQDGPIQVDVAQSMFGKLTIIFKEEDFDRMQQSIQLFNLVDSTGEEIYPGGIWTLQGVLPIINMFGKREGFRGEAKLTDITSGNDSF